MGGIMPYITASIIMQLLSVVHPPMLELKKEGEAGRRKISQYARYLTLVLAIFQSIGISTGLPNLINGLVINPGFGFYFTAVVKKKEERDTNINRQQTTTTQQDRNESHTQTKQ